MKRSKSSFDGLKAGARISALKPTLKTEYSVLRVGLRALICAGCYGSSKTQILDPQIAFERYMFEGSIKDALILDTHGSQPLP
jgi:hypothetical protein